MKIGLCALGASARDAPWARMIHSLCGIALLCLSALGVAAQTRAGGLYLQEFGTPSMSVAGAGAQAVANDASTAFHNPAGMTRLDGHQLMLTGGAVYGEVEFDAEPNPPITGGDGGNQGGVAPLLATFYSHRVSDRWRLGANLISISGAALDPDDDWAGRFQLEEVQLFTLSANPSVAYRVNDWLSLGAGLLVMYARLDMDVAVPPPFGMGRVELEGLDDVAVGWNVGALLSLGTRTRLGVTYVSETETDLSGDIEISPIGAAAAIDTDIPFAQVVRLAAYHELSERFAVLASVGWEDWSKFDEQFVSVAMGSTSIPRNWHDTWHVGLGFHYWLNDSWLLQAGAAYDSSPVERDDRSADLPMDRQIRYAIGAQYRWSEDVDVGASFVYADYGDAEIRSSLLRGEYDRNRLFFLAFRVNWSRLPWGD